MSSNKLPVLAADADAAKSAVLVGRGSGSIKDTGTHSGPCLPVLFPGKRWEQQREALSSLYPSSHGWQTRYILHFFPIEDARIWSEQTGTVPSGTPGFPCSLTLDGLDHNKAPTIEHASEDVGWRPGKAP